MSETSSDAESSCGWTIISNEGSDIETLGLEAAVEDGAKQLERPLVEEEGLQEKQESVSNAQCVEEKAAGSLDETLEEQAIDETLCPTEAGKDTKGKEHVTLLSSSDHSDIMTLGDLKEGEHLEVEKEAAADEEFYLGTSCSSQYAFTAVETIFPVQQPAVTNSSSSEDEAGRGTGTFVRRRRLRKNTTSIVTEPEEEEVHESSKGEEEEVKEQKQEKEEEEEAEPERGQGGSTLNSCVLIALLIAFSLGFGHFYGPVQSQEKGKMMCANDLDAVRHLIEEPANQVQKGDFFENDLSEQKVISLLTEVIQKSKKENQELHIKRAHIQAQRDDLEMLLKQKAEERTIILSQQQRLTAENQILKTSLEREEKSLSALQEELRILHTKIRDQEAMGANVESLQSENQRLKDRLQEEKQISQREDMTAEAQALRKKLDKERLVTAELRRELNVLRSHIPRAGKEAGPEADELQSRLTELEKRLSFEQQRSDLWERLYVETKEDRAKGDPESKVKRAKDSMTGKVKETFDAVKNSTKEFVHHHKEQIKRAKEAVKENLRKFSDSVKSTFRHFKDSASTFINKARGFYGKRRGEKSSKEPWQHRSHRPHHRHQGKFDESFQSNHNTRKSGDKVHKDGGQGTHEANRKGCSGIFGCTFQESMFDTEPIRADTFYQLLESYVQQEVDHFHHWKELEMFINNFFHNGVFIHDQMPFTDFISVVENYLTDMYKTDYHGQDDVVFRDLNDFVYRHFFGEPSRKRYGPNRPSERPDTDPKESKTKHQQRKQHRDKARAQKWSRSDRNADRHMADVKIELGPMPFDPKY